VELLPGPHEDVLRQLVCLISPGHPTDEAEHARQMGTIQPLVGLNVAGGGAHGVGTIAFERGRLGACWQRRSLTCTHFDAVAKRKVES
jgi:hypothetical protein